MIPLQEKKCLEIGVLQGSVLDFTVFLIFINDLPNCLNNFYYKIHELTVNLINQTVSLLLMTQQPLAQLRQWSCCRFP